MSDGILLIGSATGSARVSGEVFEGTIRTFEDVFEGIAKECVDLLVRKQQGYGPKNIEELGFYGVFSRLSADKIERLRNMMKGRLEKGRVIVEFTDDPTGDESIEDTLKDIVNYGLIMLALKRGQWGFPLRAEL